MKQRMVFAALAVLALSMPAAAEPMRLAQAMTPGMLPPHEIVTIVRSAGLDPVGPPRLRGRTYVLEAVDRNDQDVRVVVNAYQGSIVRVLPLDVARMTPSGGITEGPYERMDGMPAPLPPPGYVSPEPRRYGARPPVVDEDDAPEGYAPRPPAAVPGAPPRSSALPPPRGGDVSRGADLPPPSGSRIVTASPPPRNLAPVTEPHVITATEPDQNGMLPPPPERFPQRVAPAPEKPKPVKRAAAAPPKQAPLPKPRPPSSESASAAPPPPAADKTTASAPPPAPTENKPDDERVPH